MKKQGELPRTLQELNRASPRLAVSALASQIERTGPSSAPAEGLAEDELRDEIAALSTFFIADLWTHLTAYLGGLDAVLVRPTPDGRGFTRLEALVGDDPVVELAACVEALLVSFGRFTEHQGGHGTDPRRVAAHRRYRELVSQIPPAGVHTPTSHAAGNALAGMQLTLALMEVVPQVYARSQGQPMTAAGFDVLLAGTAFEQLVHTVGASCARVSNAVLAVLAPARFAIWSHSMLALETTQRSARRLMLSADQFELVADGEGGWQVELTTAALDEVRALAASIATPGRAHQLTCPAFAAAAARGEHVFGAFTRWLVVIGRRYLGPRLV